ncbi:MAG TPA: universal stress protein [Bacteroidia bacterium]|nr:universal stress protein [Bacteroidia bacterium]
MKTILVPTDFSKNAENALHYAINLAEKTHAKIILLHSFHIDYTNAYVPPNIVEKEIEEAKVNSNKQLKILYNKVSHHAKHPIECVSSQNLAVDAILNAVKDHDVDLIVMGTAGATGMLGRQIFGTNSSRVIEKAPCPVIAVPENNLHPDIKTIVYATTYLNSDIDCLQNLVSTAKLFDANIQVVHVSLLTEDGEHEKKRMEKFKQIVTKSIAYEKMTFKTLLGHSIEERLERYMEERKDVDMLVMSAHYRNLMDKLFGKSITKVMALYLKTPLMIYHHKRNKSDNATDYAVEKLIF